MKLRHGQRALTKCVCALCVVVSLVACSVTSPQSVEPLPQTQPYPAHWWQPVPVGDAASWEILPQQAGPGQVILSKRNELGLLSNFAVTPFVFGGQPYASLEGFWQMMKYPESPADPRATHRSVTWRHSRQEVAGMVGFDAKAAGNLASQNMRIMGIDWVTFEGRRMEYRMPDRGAHYRLIVQATRAKVEQNPRVREVLLSTGDLILRPDHKQSPDAPPAWRYHEILMQIRQALRDQGHSVKTGSPAL